MLRVVISQKSKMNTKAQTPDPLVTPCHGDKSIHTVNHTYTHTRKEAMAAPT